MEGVARLFLCLESNSFKKEKDTDAINVLKKQGIRSPEKVLKEVLGASKCDKVPINAIQVLKDYGVTQSPERLVRDILIARKGEAVPFDDVKMKKRKKKKS